MRIMIATDSKNGLASNVNPHFGRCPHYLLIDIEGREIKAIEDIDNPFHQQHAPGQIPNFISEQGAEVMIAGGMGFRAIHYFEQLGIEAIAGAEGTVLKSLALYLMGDLQNAAPCATSKQHHKSETRA
jgi:predicted Fe-Mo cluster-binding NifX family protein